MQSLPQRFVMIVFMNHLLISLQNFKLIIIKKPLHKLNNRYNLYSYISLMHDSKIKKRIANKKIKPYNAH